MISEIENTMSVKEEGEHEYLKGKTLLQIARSAIIEELGKKNRIKVDSPQDAPWLQEEGACFITLMQGTQLRGCIGSLEAHRSLLDDVKANAKAAAIQDNRFPPLTLQELGHTQIEVSLLSPVQELTFKNQQDALAQLVPETDGVLFEYEQYRATFLPQVWRQLPERKEFIAHLKQKAGLSADFWSDEVKLSRYSVKKWKESDFDDLPGQQ